MRRLTRFVILAAIALSALPAAPAAAAPRAAVIQGYHYFAETGHSISGRAAAFYAANGGLPVFGLPLTEPISTSGGLVQYFERARFDLLPDEVRLAPTGLALAETRSGAAFTPPELGPEPRSATGFVVDSIFREPYSRSGPALFGEPTSMAFLEDGKLVQYFERTRLEWSAESGFEIGLVGQELAALSGLDAAARAPVPEKVLLASATVAFPAASRTNIALAAARLNGTLLAPDEADSFLALVGEVSTARGYTESEVVIKEQVAKAVGGGICYAATAIYRAALKAGLPIVERRGHSIAIESFQDWPGTDVAVDTTSYDLRWANDTGANLLLTVQLDPQADTVTAQLLGQPDGREVTLSAPELERTEPDAPRYLPDAALPPNSSQETTAARPALTVSFRRTIRQDGKRHTETFRSDYAAVQAVISYGAGFVPPASSAPSSPNSTPSTP